MCKLVIRCFGVFLTAAVICVAQAAEQPFGDQHPYDSIQYWNGDAWSSCASGTSIGANKVDRFNPTRVQLMCRGP
jgi:hypothetical protein